MIHSQKVLNLMGNGLLKHIKNYRKTLVVRLVSCAALLVNSYSTRNVIFYKINDRIGLTHDMIEYTHDRSRFTHDTIGLIYDRIG